MDHLWTPWRYHYISGLSDSETTDRCVFCDIPRGVDEEQLIITRGRYNYIVLNRFPYTSGHSLVVPFRHFAAFHDIRPSEWNELGELSQRLQQALAETYHPEGFNIGWNQGKCAGAGVADHIHLHLVPRWMGDTNLVGVLGETRIIPEELTSTYEKLRRFFT
ncbi:MAG: HIT domain-containing protein [Acidobacteria bacterium]|nr:HIT domain-containing protein [Acidobacteriota bacterium]